MMPNDPATHSWHVDRRIPLALIWTVAGCIALQSIGAIVWGVTLTNRVSNVEVAIASRTPIVDRFLTVEASVGIVSTRLNRIEDKLDRIIEGRTNGGP